MRIRRNTVWGLLLAAALIVLVLTGCRAFQPEAVIVNKAPETYIIGAPVEDGGGYFHFHVFWYGSDADGRVDRFVWALTDTTVQDDDTVDDEEDTRFNPALDASTLDIGHWTTRTDSIFDFKIEQGVRPSADFTLHMVAVDDFGEFDRTPARLHFFSNTLGNPVIEFARVEDGDTTTIALGASDTVGFGLPYTVTWSGSSPNIRGYDREALAKVDTVYPFDDGLFGYKWQILGALGGNCVPTLQDCWRPRLFNESTGDSFSYFGSVTSLTFQNDRPDADNPFQKLLPSGAVNLLVNSIDVAGVEVAEFQREFQFVVNYDPQTIVLDGETDWAHPEDPQSYPYYIRLNDPAQTKVPFASGDTIPDRSYVVVKALGRDDPRDTITRPGYGIGLAGFVQGARSNLTGGIFRFSTESSVLDTMPDWGANEDGWFADTLGFMVAPRSEFTVNMQAVDEHGRRDGSPAQLSFHAGYAPCVQCVEILPKNSLPSVFPPDIECVTPDGPDNGCFADTASYWVTASGLGADELQRLYSASLAVNKVSGFTQIVQDTTGLGANNYLIAVDVFNLSVLLHGQDDPREAWSEANRRIMAWRYQVDYECDPFNQIKDGGGNDDIDRYTWGEAGDSSLEIESNSGLWKMGVEVAVPQQLLTAGSSVFYTVLLFTSAAGDSSVADFLYESSLRQLGAGTVRTVALDQSQCGKIPVRPLKYNYFRAVRPSVASPPVTRTWRDCDLQNSGSVPGIKDGLDLSQGAMESDGGTPLVKNFRLKVRTLGGEEIDCNSPLPHQR